MLYIDKFLICLKVTTRSKVTWRKSGYSFKKDASCNNETCLKMMPCKSDEQLEWELIGWDKN